MEHSRTILLCDSSFLMLDLQVWCTIFFFFAGCSWILFAFVFFLFCSLLVCVSSSSSLSIAQRCSRGSTSSSLFRFLFFTFHANKFFTTLFNFNTHRQRHTERNKLRGKRDVSLYTLKGDLYQEISFFLSVDQIPKKKKEN